MTSLRETATALGARLARLSPLARFSDDSVIPAFALRCTHALRYSVFDVSERLRVRRWRVLAYALPPHAQRVVTPRLGVCEAFSRNRVDLLWGNWRQGVAQLERDRLRRPRRTHTRLCHG